MLVRLQEAIEKQNRIYLQRLFTLFVPVFLRIIKKSYLLICNFTFNIFVSILSLFFICYLVCLA
jgi:putative effector of murein hydrolase LrgA (UPF0299 family)